MTQVDFYVLKEGARLNREHLVCVLASKAFMRDQRLYIHASTPHQVDMLDDLLWTFKDISFLPHQMLREGYTADTPILIGCDEAPPEEIKLMINMAHSTPPFFSRFERMIEVVSQEPEIRQQARQRYRYYQDCGCPLNLHEITSFHGKDL
jgi:DNA polymerase-3 subunit chi